MAEHYKRNQSAERAKRKSWYEKNKSNISEKGKIERRNSPEKTKQVNFRRNLRNYGINEEQYFLRLRDQNYACAICMKPFIGTPHIDHCHETQEFRGILHHECNTAFGLLKEEIANFQGCIAYKLKYKR